MKIIISKQIVLKVDEVELDNTPMSPAATDLSMSDITYSQKLKKKFVKTKSRCSTSKSHRNSRFSSQIFLRLPKFKNFVSGLHSSARDPSSPTMTTVTPTSTRLIYNFLQASVEENIDKLSIQIDQNAHQNSFEFV